MSIIDRVLNSIDSKKAQWGFIFYPALTRAKRYLWPILEIVGEERIKFLIESNCDLDQVLSSTLKEALVSTLAQYRWTLDVLDDTDLVNLLPPQVREVTGSTAQGRQWLQRQIDWIRQVASQNTGKEAS